jgi:TetR/AcrR family transcriptional regulator, mexJK operon transcriptional repressor
MALARKSKAGHGKADARLELTRETILSGAKAVFLQVGFASASMDAIAAKAGVSKMTIYRHFPSKEVLFAGVISSLCDMIVGSDLQGIFDRPPREALTAFARKMIEITLAPETVELHRIVVAESRRFPELGRRFYLSGPQACIRALEVYLTHNRSKAGFEIRDPRRNAEEFLELLRGYAHLRLLLGIGGYPTRSQIDSRVRRAVELVYQGKRRPRR